MRHLVLIPTYNEKENISNLIPNLSELGVPFDVLVIDDNSPDGTAAVVADLAKKFPFVHLLQRPGKLGLGKAYLDGIRWGMAKGYETFVEMDADFSHRPVDLVRILEALKDFDVVVGSRWVKGGGVVNWPLFRKVISLGGSFYSRCVLGYPLKDWTGGFNGWRRDVFSKVPVESIRSEGYSFQIELKYRAIRAGYRCLEVPILFQERVAGQSKMSMRIFVEALWKVWLMRSWVRE